MAPVHTVPFHRSLCLLASLAMVLIVCAPLVSRWIVHGAHAAPTARVALTPGPQKEPAGGGTGHAHLHAGPPHMHEGAAPPAAQAQQGHAHHHLATALPDLPDLPVADRHAGHAMAADCDYCLMAARLLSLLVAVLLVLLTWVSPRHRRPAVVGRLVRVHAGHLGARGPPLSA